LNVDTDRVGGLAVHRHDHVDFTKAAQVKCQRHVDLVETGILRLRIGVKNRHSDATERAGYVCE